MSGDRLGKGHGGAAAYPGSGVGDGGIARSYKRSRQWSGGFRHGLSGWRARRGEWPGYRGSAVGSGTGCQGGVAAVGSGHGTWQPRGDGVLMIGPGTESGD
jgi:hypothetical protein